MEPSADAPPPPVPASRPAPAARPQSAPGEKRARHKRRTRVAAAATVVVLAGFVAYLGIALSQAASKPSLRTVQEQGCLTFMDGIARQVRDFESKRGRLPATLADLRDPELDSTYDAEPWDCWHKPIEYRIVDAATRDFMLRSYGPDVTPGTKDDLVWPTGAAWR